MFYDWSTSKDDQDRVTIRWAAFYSDVEQHEVLEGMSGHRVTLVDCSSRAAVPCWTDDAAPV